MLGTSGYPEGVGVAHAFCVIRPRTLRGKEHPHQRRRTNEEEIGDHDG